MANVSARKEIHEKICQHVCNHCPKIFNPKISLINHIKSKHLDNKFCTAEIIESQFLFQRFVGAFGLP